MFLQTVTATGTVGVPFGTSPSVVGDLDAPLPQRAQAQHHVWVR